MNAAEKGQELATAIDEAHLGGVSNVIYAVNPASFSQVPGTPFAYWVSDRIRGLFTHLSPMRDIAERICFGLSTKDDFRFLRTYWEVPTSALDQRWFNFVKGGEFSHYYSDPHLVIDWEQDGLRLKAYANHRTAQLFGKAGWSRWINNWDYYFRPGLTWSRRSQRGLSIRTMPTGCIFADKGPGIFSDQRTLLYLLCVTNSAAFCTLVDLQMAFGSYEVGVIQQIVMPKAEPGIIERLSDLGHTAWTLKRESDTAEETSHAFVLPPILQASGDCLASRINCWHKRVASIEAKLDLIQSQIDDESFQLYNISDQDRPNLEMSTKTT